MSHDYYAADVAAGLTVPGEVLYEPREPLLGIFVGVEPDPDDPFLAQTHTVTFLAEYERRGGEPYAFGWLIGNGAPAMRVAFQVRRLHQFWKVVR